jgi:AcrR family transcriptional regulator
MAGRGRPLSFDRDVALGQAMEVFWTKGYSGAQLTDLTSAMGINPPSFYAAFGSKKDAFREAVSLYIRTVGSRPMKALERAKTAREGLRAMLERSIDVALSNEAKGCLLVLGATSTLSDSEEAWTCLKEAREKTLDLIFARIRRGVDEGDLPGDIDAKTTATYFLALTQAISFQARDGATRNALRKLIVPAMAALPSHPFSQSREPDAHGDRGKSSTI